MFNYINSLSPIRPVKSIPIPHPFSSLSFTSPPSVFTSPHLTSSHKESRFFKTHHSSSHPTNPLESRHDSTSNEQVLAEAEAELTRRDESSIEVAHDDPVASPCGGDTTDLSLVPYAPPRGENCSSEDAGMELQKMYDNVVQGKNQTPDWECLISDASELLIFGSPNDSEAFRCLMMQRASTSEARFCSDEPESSDAVPYEVNLNSNSSICSV